MSNKMYCCYEDDKNKEWTINKKIMVDAKENYGTYLRYHSMFWELKSRIPSAVLTGAEDSEKFGWVVRHMWEMLSASKDHVDSWNLNNEYILGTEGGHAGMKTMLTADVLGNYNPNSLPFCSSIPVNLPNLGEKAFITYCLELAHVMTAELNAMHIKFQLNEFLISSGIGVDTDYGDDPNSNFISYVGLLEALKPGADPYNGESYSLSSWDLYERIQIGIQAHIKLNHYFRGTKFYNIFFPETELRATAIYDKFGSFLWKQYEKLAIASERRLEIVISEFDVYTEGFCEDTTCDEHRRGSLYNFCERVGDEIGTVYPSLYSQGLLDPVWEEQCEIAMSGNHEYGDAKEYIAGKFYEAFYYQTIAHPQVYEITLWNTWSGQNNLGFDYDRPLDMHLSLSNEENLIDGMAQLNPVTPQDSVGNFYTDGEVKERIIYSHEQFASQFKTPDVTVNLNGDSEVYVDNLPFGTYEIMYSDGTSKYFDVPIKAGKAFNQESELSGRYCEDLDRNDFRTCHKERQKTRGEKNSKEFSVSI